MNTVSNVSSKTPAIASTPTARVKNVVDTAAANGSFKTFGNALRRSGLALTAKDPQRYIRRRAPLRIPYWQ